MTVTRVGGCRGIQEAGRMLLIGQQLGVRGGRATGWLGETRKTRETRGGRENLKRGAGRRCVGRASMRRRGERESERESESERPSRDNGRYGGAKCKSALIYISLPIAPDSADIVAEDLRI